MVTFTGSKRRKSNSYPVSGSESEGRLAENLAVLTPEEFLVDWEMEASQAREKVIGQTMWFEGQRSGEIVTKIFCEAAPQHVEKVLLVDWLSMIWSDWTSLPLAFLNPFTKNRILEIAARKEQMWKQMKVCGVKLTFTNPPKNIFEKIWPVTGRNHLKAAGVDRRVFYVGGFNFGNLEMDLADFMVKVDDKIIAGKLFDEWERVNSRIVVEDREIELDGENTLLVDGGTARKSIILDRVAELVSSSKAFALAITANWVPDNSLAMELERAAERGVKVESIRGKDRVVHKWPINSLHLFWLVGKLNEIVFRLHKYQIPVLVNKKRGVHAKLLIIDGQVAMFGTHNLTDKGVKAGTKEWMIVTRNKKLVGNLMKFYENLRNEVVG